MRNIVFKGKDQGFKLDESSTHMFENCGFTCTTTGADSAGLFILNSFWSYFEYCAMFSASNAKPSVIMRGDNTAANVNSSSAMFRNCTFATGGVQFETNVTPTNGGHGIFDGCIIENSTMPMVTFLEGTAIGGYGIGGLRAISCQVADPQAANVPLIRINSAAGHLDQPVIASGAAGTYARAIEVVAGRVDGAVISDGTHVTNASGVPYTGSVGSYQTQKGNGSTWVGTSANANETGLLEQAGPFIKMARNGDSYSRAGIETDGTITWGPGGAVSTGYDTNLYRSAANRIKTDDNLHAVDGVTTKYKAGTPVDGDFATTPPDGTIVVDSSANKIWTRIGGTWKGVVVA